MARLEARLIARIADQGAAQKEFVFEALEEVLEVFDEEVSAPLARQLTACANKSPRCKRR